jgi:hypothetical protein
MIRSTLVGGILAVLCSAAQAAILVTSEHGAATSQQFFEDGNFVLMENGRPAFGVDASGNCWFIEGQRLIFDTCAQMLDSVNEIREQAMAGIGEQGRAMMQQMLAAHSGGAVSVRPLGERTIAGYQSSCHAIGDSREVCVSSTLLEEVKGEMGSSRFADMMQRFQNSASEMVGENPQVKALGELFERGYPMSDMQKSAGIPGMNSAMLQFLPEAQRAQLMQQMGAAGTEGKMQGSRVTGVDKRANMPKVDFARYRRLTFNEFMQQTMGQMPGMPRR